MEVNVDNDSGSDVTVVVATEIYELDNTGEKGKRSIALLSRY